MGKRVLPLALFLLLLAAGCRTPLREDRIEKADLYFELIKRRTVPPDQIFTLEQCVKTALQNNLDLKVFTLSEKINKERTTAGILAMLPDLYATYDITSRNNEPGATSISLETGEESLVPSRSASKTTGVVKVEMAFSVVDFGLSYFKALQAKDQGRLTLMQRSRASQNLVFDVATAYYRVAAAQYAMANTEKLLELSKIVETNLDHIAKTKSLSPMKVLAEKKQILKLKQSLEEYRRVYENSCIELKSLMGYAPWNPIQVDTAPLSEFNEVETPPIDVMEMLAIRERPELYQLDIQAHIAVNEARKAIVMMFPNVRMFVDFTNSSNPLLYNHSWFEIGIRAAYHLLRLPQQFQEWRALDLKIDEWGAKTHALTAGVMAQVRIAHANLFEVEQRFKLSEAIYITHRKQLKAAKEDAKAGGRVSQIQLFKMAMETANASIERTQQLGNYYLAYHRLLNAIGIQSFDKVSKLIEEYKTISENEKLYSEAELAKFQAASKTVDPMNTPSDKAKITETPKK